MHLAPTVRLHSRLAPMVSSWAVVVGCNSAGLTNQPVSSESAATSPHSADSSSTGGAAEDPTNSETLLPNSDSSAPSVTRVSTPPSSSPGTSDDEPASIAVTGHIIDFWGHSVPDVSVAIDDAKTLTDAEGNFTLRAVPPYDVSLAIRIRGEITEIYGYRFVGLTRVDPTLQIFKGLPQRTSPLTLRAPTIGANPRWVGELAIGGQHGQRAYALTTNSEGTAGWRGPTEHTTPTHVLLWETSETDRRVPSLFLSWQQGSLALTQSVATSIEIDLPADPTPLPAHEVRMVTESAPGTSHIAASYVRFDGGPAIALSQMPRLSDDPLPFVTLAPQLTAASITLAAISGSGAHDTPFSIVYANQIEPEDTATLTFLANSELEAPPHEAKEVAWDTSFTWTDAAQTYVVTFEDLDVHQTVYVITSDPHTSIPNLEPLGVYYPHGGTYRWAVESHGNARSLDELCSGPGYLDPFSGDFHYPMGPRRGEGRFWRTASRLFTFH